MIPGVASRPPAAGSPAGRRPTTSRGPRTRCPSQSPATGPPRTAATTKATKAAARTLPWAPKAAFCEGVAHLGRLLAGRGSRTPRNLRRGPRPRRRPARRTSSSSASRSSACRSSSHGSTRRAPAPADDAHAEGRYLAGERCALPSEPPTCASCRLSLVLLAARWPRANGRATATGSHPRGVGAALLITVPLLWRHRAPHAVLALVVAGVFACLATLKPSWSVAAALGGRDLQRRAATPTARRSLATAGCVAGMSPAGSWPSSPRTA